MIAYSSPPIGGLAVCGAQRGLGDVLAALRTTTRYTRQPHLEGRGTFRRNWTGVQLFDLESTISASTKRVSHLLFTADETRISPFAAAAVGLNDIPSSYPIRLR